MLNRPLSEIGMFLVFFVPFHGPTKDRANIFFPQSKWPKMYIESRRILFFDVFSMTIFMREMRERGPSIS